MIYALTLAFMGTAYSGWQVQKNAPSVQSAVQDAAERVFGTRLDVTGCSRTDSGVHAKGYVCHIESEKHIDPYKLPRALNMYLPPDISVLAAREAGDGFHARYSALGKEYIYLINDSGIRNPFYEGLAFKYHFKTDAEKANLAGKAFEGRHDFASFMAAGSKITDTVRTVFYFRVTREEEGGMLKIVTAADGFLYNMVRIMVGTLLKSLRVGPDIKSVISAADRKAAGPTVPPQGLYLNRVFYDPGELGE